MRGIVEYLKKDEKLPNLGFSPLWVFTLGPFSPFFLGSYPVFFPWVITHLANPALLICKQLRRLPDVPPWSL